jgi:hypothetical protein
MAGVDSPRPDNLTTHAVARYPEAAGDLAADRCAAKNRLMITYNVISITIGRRNLT